MKKSGKIKPKIVFDIDKTTKIFFLLPTIVVQPWKYRYYNTFVLDICWLNFHIGIGVWEYNENNT